MSKTPRSARPEPRDIRPEYRFDYSQAKPNRFADGMTQPVVAVVLEADVAAVFNSSAKVNKELRAAMTARAVKKRSAATSTRRRRAS